MRIFRAGHYRSVGKLTQARKYVLIHAEGLMKSIVQHTLNSQSSREMAVRSSTFAISASNLV